MFAECMFSHVGMGAGCICLHVYEVQCASEVLYAVWVHMCASMIGACVYLCEVLWSECSCTCIMPVCEALCACPHVSRRGEVCANVRYNGEGVTCVCSCM